MLVDGFCDTNSAQFHRAAQAANIAFNNFYKAKLSRIQFDTLHDIVFLRLVGEDIFVGLGYGVCFKSSCMKFGTGWTVRLIFLTSSLGLISDYCALGKIRKFLIK